MQTEYCEDCNTPLQDSGYYNGGKICPVCALRAEVNHLRAELAKRPIFGDVICDTKIYSIHHVPLIATGIAGNGIEIIIDDTGSIHAFGTRDLTVIPDEIRAIRYESEHNIHLVIHY